MTNKKKFTEEDDDILAKLGIEVEVKKQQQYTNKEQRIIAGFEEIQQFVEEHGRLPRHGEDLDIFERLYAVRLDQIRPTRASRACGWPRWRSCTASLTTPLGTLWSCRVCKSGPEPGCRPCYKC